MFPKYDPIPELALPIMEETLPAKVSCKFGLVNWLVLEIVLTPEALFKLEELVTIFLVTPAN